jgi:transcriptional regulator with XRE-family HTH domain
MTALRWAATVRRIRKRRHLTQGELAAELGVHVNSVSRWETGVHPPHRYLEEKILSMAGAPSR